LNVAQAKAKGSSVYKDYLNFVDNGFYKDVSLTKKGMDGFARNQSDDD
jgi:hypothetical protein